MRPMRWLVLVALLALLGAGCDPVDAPLDGASDAGPTDARPVDGGVADGGIDDAPMLDAGVSRCGPAEGPARVLFIGNSFTFTASMPEVFDAMARAGGFPDPEVVMRAVGGQTLGFHRDDTSAEGAPARIAEGGWDVVILQEFSTRPTDALGDPEQFEIDATWLHDRILESSPAARVMLYETFARRAGHPFYPGTFSDPGEMQAQLRFWYDDCASRYVPAMSSFEVGPVEVARVGDAWELSLADGEPPRLHGDDDYHPNSAGAYLTAAVFFGTIYRVSAAGLPAIGIDDATAADLQSIADEITGYTELAPAIACPPELPIGDRVLVDFGPDVSKGWITHGSISGTVGPVPSEAGIATGVSVITRGFTGTQTGGSDVNALGLPAAVSRDSLWVGSFDGHAAALTLTGEVTFTGLVPGAYTITLFASRDGDDGGAGRLTRYTISTEATARSADLEVTDNQDRAITFEDLTPDAMGRITVRVAVSPDGGARFGYVGSATLARTE